MLECAFGAPVTGKRRIYGVSDGTIRKSDMVVSIVTIVLSLTIWPQFAIECLRPSTGAGHFGQNLGRKGLTDVSQILHALGKTWWRWYRMQKRDWHWTDDRHADRPRNGNIKCNWQCTVWVKKNPPYGFLKFFPKRLGIFNQFFTHLLCDHFYTRLQIFIRLSPTLTKLCHTKRDHLANFYISLEL